MASMPVLKESLYQMLCGTEPFPELYRAKKYKIHQKYLTKVEFQFIMRSLPVKVAELEIEEMFRVADVDNDGKIGYKVLCDHDHIRVYFNAAMILHLRISKRWSTRQNLQKDPNPQKLISERSLTTILIMF